MKWIQEHLNITAMKQKPHRWFVAALLSPILFGTKLYHHKYHLNYVHAKKLFVFDIALLLGTVLLIFASYAWHTYDPTITDFIVLNIEVLDEQNEPISKIESGSGIHYLITYENTSDIVLNTPVLTLTLPEFFQVEAIDSTATYNPLSGQLALPDLAPEAAGEILVRGRYFGIPEISESVTIALEYIQAGRTQIETRRAQIISTLRGSIISMNADFNSQILGSSATPFTLTLANNSDIALEQVSIPRYPRAQLELIPADTFEKTNQSILIGTLAPNSSLIIPGTLRSTIPVGVQSATFSLAPSIRINETAIPQSSLHYAIDVLHPEVSASFVWNSDSATPGETKQATLTLRNTGSETVQDVSVWLPNHTNIINTNKLTYPIFASGIQAIASIDQIGPGETNTYTLDIPISSRPTGGTDILFSITPTISGTVGTDMPFTAQGTGSAIKVGSALSGNSHALYYTPEGDQLGRGPLPPRVGDETKYLSVITLENTSSRMRTAQLTGYVPENVRFTGKTSVSAGNEITYNESTRLLTWENFSVPAYQTIGLYIELGLTPTTDMIGTTPTLLQNISLRATDTHTGIERRITLPELTASLDSDSIGTTKGDIVVN